MIVKQAQSEIRGTIISISPLAHRDTDGIFFMQKFKLVICELSYMNSNNIKLQDITLGCM